MENLPRGKIENSEMNLLKSLIKMKNSFSEGG